MRTFNTGSHFAGFEKTSVFFPIHRPDNVARDSADNELFLHRFSPIKKYAPRTPVLPNRKYNEQDSAMGNTHGESFYADNLYR